MTEALLAGLIASSSLVLGAVVGLRVPIGDRALGLLMGLGAGALVSSLAFELAEEAIQQGGFVPLALGLAAGALAFYTGDRLLERGSGPDRTHRPRGADTEASGGTLALGALLDGMPEQAAIGIGLAAGGPVGVSLIAAVFLSNVPEAVASAAAMKERKRPAGMVLALWAGVALAGTVATVLGRVVLGDASGDVTAFVLAVAAGAVIVMLTDAMIPTAVRKGGKAVGLVTCLGFALAVLADQL